jgi:hypothetical protein
MIEDTISKLPASLRQAINGLYEGSGFPKAMTMTTALATVNYAAQRLYNADSNKWGVMPLTEFFVIMQPRSGGKSTLYRTLMKPVQEHKENSRLQYNEDLERYEAEHAIYLKEMKKLTQGDPIPFKPFKPQHYDPFIQNATVNGIISHLTSCSNAGIFTTEGAMFINGYDSRQKQSDATMSTALSQLWSNEELTKDTGVEKIRLPNRRCNMLLMLQKDLAGPLFDKEKDDQGLTSRFLFVDSADWNIPEESDEQDQKVVQQNKDLQPFYNRLRAMLLKPTVQSKYDPYELVLETLYFSNDPDVQADRREFFNLVTRWRNESTGKDKGDSLLSKLYEHSCRLAGTIAAYNGKAEIDREAWEAGKALAEFYYSELLMLQAPVDESKINPVTLATEKLETWMLSREIKIFSKPDLSQKSPRAFRNLGPDQRAKVLDTLVMDEFIELAVIDGKNVIRVI